MQQYLIVIDMQNDFISGSLGTAQAQAIVPAVVALVKQAAQEGRAILFTQDTHTPNYLHTSEGEHLPVPHCIEGTEGWEIHPDLAPFADDVIRKPTFGSTELALRLSAQAKDGGKNIDISLCGLCTDICVVSNALLLKAFMPEAAMRTYADCCAGVTPEKHLAALEVMRSCQVDIV